MEHFEGSTQRATEGLRSDFDHFEDGYMYGVRAENWWKVLQFGFKGAFQDFERNMLGFVCFLYQMTHNDYPIKLYTGLQPIPWVIGSCLYILKKSAKTWFNGVDHYEI